MSKNTTENASQTPGKAEARREAILEAAGAVLVEWGVEKFTLDAVAEHAGISKGGLIYHFRSKDDLLLAMVEGLMARSDADIEAEIRRAGEPEGTPGRFLRAYVRSCLGKDGSLSENESQMLAISTVLLGAVTKQPRLLEAIRVFDGRWQERTQNDGIDFYTATVLRAATDGMWMSMLLGFESGFESRAQRAAIRQTLLRMIDEAAQTALQTSAPARKRRKTKSESAP